MVTASEGNGGGRKRLPHEALWQSGVPHRAEAQGAMPKFVEVDQYRGLVEVTFFGEVTYGERIETMQFIFPPMIKYRLKRLLLNFSAARHGVPDGRREELLNKILAAPALIGTRVAFVNSMDLKGLPAQKVPPFESRIFDSRDEAEEWLLH